MKSFEGRPPGKGVISCAFGVDKTARGQLLCFIEISHKGLRKSPKERAFLICGPPHITFKTWLNTSTFQEATPDLVPATVAILLNFSPWNTVCPLWRLSAETSGLSPETRLCCVTLHESLSLSGPQILGQMTLQVPQEPDVLLNIALKQEVFLAGGVCLTWPRGSLCLLH